MLRSNLIQGNVQLESVKLKKERLTSDWAGKITLMMIKGCLMVSLTTSLGTSLSLSLSSNQESTALSKKTLKSI